MSAVEIPNFFEAAGFFVPVPPLPPITVNIPSSVGFEEYDPDTDPAAAIGGFTRVSAGVYFLGLLNGIDPFEGSALVQLSGSPLAAPQAFIPPRVAPYNKPIDGKTVAVTTTDLVGAPADPQSFYCVVFRFATGPRFSY